MARDAAECLDAENSADPALQTAAGIHADQPAVPDTVQLRFLLPELLFQRGVVRKREQPRLFQRSQHDLLKGEDHCIDRIVSEPFRAVRFLFMTVDIIKEIGGQPVHECFAVLLFQIFHNIPVAEMAVSGEKLTDNADPLLFLTGLFDCGKIRDDPPELPFQQQRIQVLACPEIGGKRFDPLLHTSVRCTLLFFIRADLLGKIQQKIAVLHGEKCTHEHEILHPDLVVLALLHTECDDLHIRDLCFFQRFFEDLCIIGTEAAVAECRHQQQRVFQIILSALQCGDDLTDVDDAGIAHIIVDVL